jgi:hypothetical protein
MTADFTKFPFPALHDPEALRLTQAIAADPVPSGFAVITLKAREPTAMAGAIRAFAASLREEGDASGFIDITAFRQLRRDELGGAMPFDQPVCEGLLASASTREPTRQSAGLVTSIVLGNARADWVVLVEFDRPEEAKAAIAEWAKGEGGFAGLAPWASEHTLGAFKNMKRYAAVSRDPNAIQFFNLFPGPGRLEVLWPAWQEALPWFFEVGEIRSSFPLVALDPEQPLLLVNHAHCDSTKHFLIGTLYDPGFREVMATCYASRGVVSPMPFFCKIVPV